ncbi:hypothetical protein HJFPF1_11581 [Paramyrothecium foliicola]|nr:hypothetical protein HJFPF1_11581 [Paramyrothecium foliicola]
MAPSVEAILKHYDFDPANVDIVSARKKAAALEIIEPDPTWPQTFGLLQARIQSAIGSTALEINHVGSTSVPGLPAKAIIDIDIVVANPTNEASYVPQLEAAGFQFHIREPEWHQHRLFLSYEPWAHLHVFGTESPEVARHQILRQWLLEHEDDRELYARAKREAAEQSTKAGELMWQYNRRKEDPTRFSFGQNFHRINHLATATFATKESSIRHHTLRRHRLSPAETPVAMQFLTRLVRPSLARALCQSPRTFATLTPLRPSLSPSTAAIRPNLTSFAPSPLAANAADLVPKSAISAHPALAGAASQMRCGPRNTMNGHTRLIQKRRHGFLARIRSKTGRKILQRRRAKGRKKLSW